MTTVEVKEERWKALNRMKSPGESMDDVIKRLVEAYQPAHEPPTKAEKLPWCGTCECFAVPTDAGECGDCGGEVRLREGLA